MWAQTTPKKHDSHIIFTPRVTQHMSSTLSSKHTICRSRQKYKSIFVTHLNKALHQHCQEKSVLTRALPNILFVLYFGPNSTPNSVFIFGRIVLQKIHWIRIIVVTMRPLLACSCTKPRKQTLSWARHSKQLLSVCLSMGDSGPQVSGKSLEHVD